MKQPRNNLVDPMNQVLSLVHAARTPSADGLGLSSDTMRGELLALHQEMIVQLQRERPGGASTVDFLQSMIAQHENAAAKLRARLALAEGEPLKVFHPSAKQSSN
jgi:hypothetical protein